MARSIRNNTLETRTARLKLPIATKPVFARVGAGVGLGYRRNHLAGAWVARLSDGKGGYAIKTIGMADDFENAAPPRVLDYWQAIEAARRLAHGAPEKKPEIVTVTEALDRYAAHLETVSRDKYNVSRVRRHLTPALAKRPIALLDAAELRRWRDTLAKRMTVSAVNRTCQSLKAALNLAADQDRALDRHAWRVGLARIETAYNSASNVILPERVVAAIVTEAREISAQFGNLTQAMAETGSRYSQLAQCRISDLIEGATPRLNIPVSRKGRGVKAVRSHPVPISAGLCARLRIAAGDRAVTEPLFLREDGQPWRHSDESGRFAKAIKAAGEDPNRVTAYALRHSWIVRQLLANVPVRLVAAMADTSVAMIEKTYSAHIDQHGDELVRAALPNVEGVAADVVPLRQG